MEDGDNVVAGDNAAVAGAAAATAAAGHTLILTDKVLRTSFTQETMKQV